METITISRCRRRLQSVGADQRPSPMPLCCRSLHNTIKRSKGYDVIAALALDTSNLSFDSGSVVTLGAEQLARLEQIPLSLGGNPQLEAVGFKKDLGVDPKAI